VKPPEMMSSGCCGHDAEITVGIERADVTGAEPTVGVKRLLGRRPPAARSGEHVGTAQEDLAD